MRATIIADDLTGACDAGCLFAGAGPVGVIVDPSLRANDRPVVAMDTESRALPSQEAARRLKDTARRLEGRLKSGNVFKKIDSTMRGPVGAEVAGLLETGLFSTALVCPAFPDQRRVVIHGLLQVDGVLAHESPIAGDPTYLAPTSEVARLLGLDSRVPVTHLSLDTVRAGREKIVHALARHPGHILAADGETDDDLARLAEAAGSVPSTLLAGSAGLGKALSQVLGLGAPPAPLPRGSGWLILIGSLHPASRAQLDVLIGAGVAGVWVDGRGPAAVEPAVSALGAGRPAWVATPGAGARTWPPHSSPREAIAQRLACAADLGRIAAAILERVTPDLIAVTGGETALALIHALGAGRLDLLGAPLSGLALGELTVSAVSTLPLLTKAGGFGRADLFPTLLRGSA